MTNQVIPAAAVEAALESAFSTSELARTVWEPTIQAILEAAAPHMLAGAWDEGYTTGNAHNGRRDANPYRPTP